MGEYNLGGTLPQLVENSIPGATRSAACMSENPRRHEMPTTKGNRRASPSAAMTNRPQPNRGAPTPQPIAIGRGCPCQGPLRRRGGLGAALRKPPSPTHTYPRRAPNPAAGAPQPVRGDQRPRGRPALSARLAVRPPIQHCERLPARCLWAHRASGTALTPFPRPQPLC
jgi:hypothetical protein